VTGCFGQCPPDAFDQASPVNAARGEGARHGANLGLQDAQQQVYGCDLSWGQTPRPFNGKPAEASGRRGRPRGAGPREVKGRDECS
jgi:hypothetical protein